MTRLGATVRVTERPPRRIPCSCPDRHVNPDGSFCLGYPPPPAPLTAADAVEWWSRLRGYLQLQLSAELIGAWPAANAWPHGDAAAKAQKELESLSARLPAAVVTAPPGILDSEPCPCGSDASLRTCHGPEMRRLNALKEAIVAGEREFWDSFTPAGRPCCGTLKSCPLRDRAPIIYRRVPYRSRKPEEPPPTYECWQPHARNGA